MSINRHYVRACLMCPRLSRRRGGSIARVPYANTVRHANWLSDREFLEMLDIFLKSAASSLSDRLDIIEIFRVLLGESYKIFLSDSQLMSDIT